MLWYIIKIDYGGVCYNASMCSPVLFILDIIKLYLEMSEYKPERTTFRGYERFTHWFFYFGMSEKITWELLRGRTGKKRERKKRQCFSLGTRGIQMSSYMIDQILLF